jgi:hypothetical protein
MPAEAKKWYQSKTMWFNMFAGLLQTADVIAASGFIPQPYGILTQTVVNLWLRMITNQPVTA